MIFNFRDFANAIRIATNGAATSNDFTFRLGIYGEFLLDQWNCPNVAQPSDDALAAINLQAHKSFKATDLKLACQNAIVSGFVSNALGADHAYPMQVTDQINLMGQIIGAQINPAGTFTMWCADSAGVWAHAAHTTQQIVAVGIAAQAHVSGNQGKYATKLAELASIMDVTEVDDLSWA
jgi:hypothetical protein